MMAKHLAILEMENNQLRGMINQMGAQLTAFQTANVVRQQSHSHVPMASASDGMYIWSGHRVLFIVYCDRNLQRNR